MISVIEGSSKGLAYQMSRSCITAGRIGGGADFEFDDPEASDIHCIVAARPDGVRIYDGASNLSSLFTANGINQVQVQASSAIEFENVSGVSSLATGTKVVLRGLLFKTAGDPILVAKKVRKP